MLAINPSENPDGRNWMKSDEIELIRSKQLISVNIDHRFLAKCAAPKMDLPTHILLLKTVHICLYRILCKQKSK